MTSGAAMRGARLLEQQLPRRLGILGQLVGAVLLAQRGSLCGARYAVRRQRRKSRHVSWRSIFAALTVAAEPRGRRELVRRARRALRREKQRIARRGRALVRQPVESALSAAGAHQLDVVCGAVSWRRLLARHEARHRGSRRRRVRRRRTPRVRLWVAAPRLLKQLRCGSRRAAPPRLCARRADRGRSRGAAKEARSGAGERSSASR